MVFINLLVLTISLNNIQSWGIEKDFFIENFFSEYVHIPWHFLIAPFFYMFLIYYLEIKEKSINILKFIIPLFIVLTALRISFVFVYNDTNNTDFEYLLEKYNTLEEFFSLIFSLTIFGYSYYILSKKELLFTKILSFDNLKWIYISFKIGTSAYVFWISGIIIAIALDYKEFIYAYYPLRILTTILIYWVGYQALLQLRLLKERKDLREKLNFPSINNKEVEISEAKDADKKLLFDKIETLLTKKKLFTQPKLTVEFLANEVDVNSNKLSNCIYLFSEKNFNDYINEYRIELAKKLLIDKTYKNYTITSIGLESGFNSKSSFYHTFKKQTGLTPSEYQKSVIQN
ncbi:MAG: helix-turn-helix domain-containing protein [Polaribacter sp.]|uniref:helix-turn-helix domain-containing protein n=1 Tax=Polaribacter sp. TaxID=1920175 RepID=UPI003BAE96CC